MRLKRKIQKFIVQIVLISVVGYYGYQFYQQWQQPKDSIGDKVVEILDNANTEPIEKPLNRQTITVNNIGNSFTHEYVHHLEETILKEQGISYEGLSVDYEPLTDLIAYRLLQEKFGYTAEELENTQMSYGVSTDFEQYLEYCEADVLEYVEQVVAFEKGV